MQKVVSVVLVLMLFSGCKEADAQMDRALSLREKVLAAKGCSFLTEITADYGEEIYTFSMECASNEAGDLTFSVIEPETIAGITGEITADGGKLTFDDTALAFGTLAEGQISPISAPWVFVHTLRGGYFASCGQEEELLRLSIDDSYEEDSLRLDIWLDAQNTPVAADILWDGRKIVTLTVDNFVFQ